MMGNRMKIRTAKALTLLSAYLLSTVGAALIALTCHCHHLHEHRIGDACHAVECCCGHDHAGHTAECDHTPANGVQLAERCCNHDHSTDTELYTAGSDEPTNIRTTLSCTDAVASAHYVPDAPLTTPENSFAERRCPPAQRCRAVQRPLRAPPVCA